MFCRPMSAAKHSSGKLAAGAVVFDPCIFHNMTVANINWRKYESFLKTLERLSSPRKQRRKKKEK